MASTRSMTSSKLNRNSSRAASAKEHRLKNVVLKWKSLSGSYVTGRVLSCLKGSVLEMILLEEWGLGGNLKRTHRALLRPCSLPSTLDRHANQQATLFLILKNVKETNKPINTGFKNVDSNAHWNNKLDTSWCHFPLDLHWIHRSATPHSRCPKASSSGASPSALACFDRWESWS